MAVIFLEQDDEITTAIARLRATQDIKVAFVLPPGSRLGTSRINFRLLMREAQGLPRQASIISTEAGVRAIAVSAGLPAYASVAEYEAALGAAASTAAGLVAGASAALPTAAIVEPTGTRAPAPTTEPAPEPEAAPEPELVAEAEPIPEAEPLAPARPAKRSRSKKVEPPAEAVAAAAAAPAVGPIEAPVPESGGGASDAPTIVMETAGLAGAAGAGDVASPAPDADVAVRDAASAAPTDIPPSAPAFGAEVASVPPPPRGPSPRSSGALPVVGGPVRATGVLGGRGALVGVLAVVGVIGAIALALAIIVLPQATITVAPPTEIVGPVSRTVTADPTAIEPDPAAGIIPAELVTIPLSAEGEFTATGVKVTETEARGSVTFSNLDATNMTTIPAGSVVSTDANVRFRTLASVRVPKAKIKGFTIDPGRASVRIEAVKAGPNGNVAANAIQNVPPGYDPVLLKVTNPAETSGGDRTESTRVSQEDVDVAVAELTRELEDHMTAALQDPATAPEGTTLIEETADMGRVKANPALDNLVGRNVQTFSLALSATGEVIAVDTGVLEPLAADALEASVPEGAILFPESIRTSAGTPTVDGGVVSFEIGASGEAWRPLDGAALLAEVQGLSVVEAEAALAEYGEVAIEVWPFYVATIPDGDRATLTVIPPTPSSQ